MDNTWPTTPLGFSGRRDHRDAELAMLKRVAPGRGLASFLTFHGRARIESSDVAAGIAAVERSLFLNLRNALRAHTLAHGHHEAGDAEAGANEGVIVATNGSDFRSN